jgi:serine/threonine protein kinase
MTKETIPTAAMSEPSDLKPERYLTHCNTRAKTTRYLLLNTKHGALCWGEIDHLVEENDPKNELDTATLTELPCQVLNVEDFFPAYDPATMLKHTASLTEPLVHTKKQRILRNDTFMGDPGRFEILMRSEIAICELLHQDPHPNIAKYMGCETTDFGDMDRVTAIVYKKYDMDLFEYAAQGLLKSKQIPMILSAVENAMKRLHKLGIVHCDLQPRNVFLRSKALPSLEQEIDEVVLGDFDSALEVGKVIEMKHAIKDWWPKDVDYGDEARPEHDMYSFGLLQPWLTERKCD